VEARRRGCGRRAGRSRGAWRALAAPVIPGALSVAIAAFPPPASPAAPDSAPSDLHFILSQAQQVQEADVAAWTRYRFRRRAERQEIGESGEVVRREGLEFQVTPGDGGFDEELLLLDGREPPAGEKERYRNLGSFAKHYRTMLSGVGHEEVEGGYSLALLLRLSSYRFAGREDREGVACYRLDFSPDQERPKERGVAWKVVSAMRGSLWIAREGFHVVAARAETVRPIPLALSLAKVHEVQVSVECGPVGEGVWLPRRIEMRTRARILVKPFHRRNLYTYSDFLRLWPPG